MEIDYDEAKNLDNVAKHSLSFDRVLHCDWDRADIRADERYDYGEARYIAYVPLEERLHVVVFTLREKSIRIISFRKANARERKLYEQESL